MYVLALMWEMGFRKMRERISFIYAIRESILATKSEGTPPTSAMDAYIEAIAPFVAEEEEKKKKEIFKLLEEESKKPLRISPVMKPTRRLKVKK
jgi:hypothetical protein